MDMRMPMAAEAAIGWGGVVVELGDQCRDVESIEGAADQFKQYKLPINAQLLGYGQFRQWSRSATDVISSVVARAIAKAAVDPADVTLLLIASADARFLVDRGLLTDVLQRCGLVAATPLAMTGQECASLLTAIDLAARYVASGTHRHVVVASFDTADPERSRIQPFGVISDAATASVVSSAVPLEFSIRSFELMSDLAGMRGEDDFASRERLIEQVTNRVLGSARATLPTIDRVFSTNFFRPIMAFNASTLGVQERQRHARLAVEIGHGLSADPLINLADYHTQVDTAWSARRYLLQAFAPGFLASMVIERAATPAAGREFEALSAVDEQVW